jgi:acetyl esterase/lipase
MAEARQHPPIDPELVETIWPTIVESFPPLTLDAVPGMREQLAADPATGGGDLTYEGRIEAQSRTIRVTPAGPELPAIILRPAGRTEALPCLYYTANGGKIIQNPATALGDVEKQWVADLGLVLVSISPRVGPEDPHPAQVEDAYAGLVWVSEHADEVGIDPSKIMVYGKSGGGGVAAATALMARDRGGPALTHQILIYPMIDDREITVSSGFENATWPGASNRVGWGAILGDAVGGPDVSPYAAPARATDLEGLPATYLEVGGSEVFRDEVIDYATRLGHVGVPTELHVWVGGFHGFELWAPDSEIGRATLNARTSYVRRALRNEKGVSE